MIGKIFSSIVPFYDNRAGRNSFKKRPVLIIGGPRNNDYTILPVSTVSNRRNLDPDYDVEIDPARYPLLHLNKVSYVRTHKQTTVHRASLTSPIGDMWADYRELYLEILGRLADFNRNIWNHASGGDGKVSPQLSDTLPPYRQDPEPESFRQLHGHWQPQSALPALGNQHP